MAYEFNHSIDIMRQLARKTARTPPSEEHPPLEYLDRSLVILGHDSDANNQKIREEFLLQREFITSRFDGMHKTIRDVEERMDRRFVEVEERMDRRFVEVEGRMDRRFIKMEERVDRRFIKMEERVDTQGREVQGIQVQLDNAAAITRNRRLRRLHQPISLVKVHRPSATDPNTLVWASPPHAPTYVKHLYALAQRAKGGFGSAKAAKSSREARRVIDDWARFYDVVPRSEWASDSDATEVALDSDTVDSYLEAVLEEWGMKWQHVQDIGDRHHRFQLQMAGVKRIGGEQGGGERQKSTRGGGDEKVVST